MSPKPAPLGFSGLYDNVCADGVALRATPHTEPPPQRVPMTPPKPSSPAQGRNRAAREITLPPRGYQPSKAELEKGVDMPGADMKTVREAFFRPIKVRTAPVKK